MNHSVTEVKKGKLMHQKVYDMLYFFLFYVFDNIKASTAILFIQMYLNKCKYNNNNNVANLLRQGYVSNVCLQNENLVIKLNGRSLWWNTFSFGIQ